MFKSFFPDRHCSFVGLYLDRYRRHFLAGGRRNWLMRLTGASADVPISAARFWAPGYLLFYAYYAFCVGVFALCWFTFSPHRWQRWSILGTALIIFVTPVFGGSECGHQRTGISRFMI